MLGSVAVLACVCCICNWSEYLGSSIGLYAGGGVSGPLHGLPRGLLCCGGELTNVDVLGDEMTPEDMTGDTAPLEGKFPRPGTNALLLLPPLIMLFMG